ncbi:MAG: hypothetical protein ACOCWA_09755 [Bacteroidota bacterium]
MKLFRNFIVFSLIVINAGCKFDDKAPDIRDIEVETNIQRFERELFELDVDTLPAAIDYFYDKYDDFYDVFSYYIVDLGRPADKAYSGYFTLFVKDDLNQDVYKEVNRVYPDLTSLEEQFNRAFAYFKYYFPNRDIPQLVSYISRFNYPYFTVSDYIGIGLDMYLGTDSEYYVRLGLPRYQVRNMHPDKIVSDVMGNYATALFPYEDSLDNVLSHLIYQGKIMYFLDKLLPAQPDSLKFGFTRDQMKWCRNNEEEMWTYLVEHELIFSTDEMNIRKLVNPAPFTAFFSSESPGRAAVYIGYNIIREYASRNPDLDLTLLMKENDYRMILESARYNP